MSGLMRRFAGTRPFDGLNVAACLHVTAETAMMVRLLRAGGAAVSLAASNPLSTQDDIAAALAVNHGTAVFARAGVDRRGYYRHIERALNHGADLVPRAKGGPRRRPAAARGSQLVHVQCQGTAAERLHRLRRDRGSVGQRLGVALGLEAKPLRDRGLLPYGPA